MSLKYALMVTLVVALTVPVLAQSDIGFKGIGGRLAYVDPDHNWDATVGFGPVVDLGTFVPRLHWDASFLYWHSSYEVPFADVSLTDFALRSSVKYHFIEGPWEPYAGGGLGLHFYHFSHNYRANYHGIFWLDTYDHDDTRLGLQILGGVQHTFSPNWKGSAEIEFDFADLDQTLLQFTVIYMLGK